MFVWLSGWSPEWLLEGVLFIYFPLYCNIYFCGFMSSYYDTDTIFTTNRLLEGLLFIYFSCMLVLIIPFFLFDIVFLLAVLLLQFVLIFLKMTFAACISYV